MKINKKTIIDIEIFIRNNINICYNSFFSVCTENSLLDLSLQVQMLDFGFCSIFH